MKFRDLPQLTRRGTYEVEYDLKFFVEHIEEEIENEGLVLNPDFQRGHVWTEEQQVAFIEYFLMGGEVGVIYLNSPNWPNTLDDGSYVCVDGLQRITSFLAFYYNKITAFGHYYREFTDRPMNRIRLSVNNLQTRKEVLQWYLEMNSGGTPHTKEEINRVKALLEKESA